MMLSSLRGEKKKKRQEALVWNSRLRIRCCLIFIIFVWFIFLHFLYSVIYSVMFEIN